MKGLKSKNLEVKGLEIKGVILAGGTGSRLLPLTKVINKHLLPVGRYPMIMYPIVRLKQAGIRKVLIVTGKEHIDDMVKMLGSGREYDLEITFRIQEEAGGIAQALGLAEDFACNHPVVVILGDNILSNDISPFINKYKQEKSGAMVLLKQVKMPQAFGVAELKDEQIIKIEEKPVKPKSNYAVTGIYMYDNYVFDIIRSLKPSARGELEITDVNNHYIRLGQMNYDILDGWWTDAGTFSSWKKACEMTWDWELHI